MKESKKLSVSDKLKQEIIELNTFTDKNVPSYIIQFTQELDKRLEEYNPTDMYPLLVDTLPDGVPEPTFNQWLYFFNICKRQQLVTDILSGIEYNVNQIRQIKCKYLKDELLSEEDRKTVHSIERVNKELHKQYESYSRDILKYTNDGLNRESREHQTDKQISASIQLSDLHKHVIDLK